MGKKQFAMRVDGEFERLMDALAAIERKTQSDLIRWLVRMEAWSQVDGFVERGALDKEALLESAMLNGMDVMYAEALEFIQSQPCNQPGYRPPTDVPRETGDGDAD